MASLQMEDVAKEKVFHQMFANHVEDAGIGLESAQAVLSGRSAKIHSRQWRRSRLRVAVLDKLDKEFKAHPTQLGGSPTTTWTRSPLSRSPM
jgi:hypothetical protein